MPNLYPIAIILFAIGAVCVVLGLVLRQHERRQGLVGAGAPGPAASALIVAREATAPDGDPPKMADFSVGAQIGVADVRPETSTVRPVKNVGARQPSHVPAEQSRDGSYIYIPPPLPPRQKLTNADLPLARARADDQSKPAIANSSFIRPALPPEPKKEPEPHYPYVPPPLVPQKKLTNADLKRSYNPVRQAEVSHPPSEGVQSPVNKGPKKVESRTPPKASRRSTTGQPVISRRGKTLQGTEYQISYTNDTGFVTDRRIRLERVFKDGYRVHIYAYCYLRDEIRQFRADRINLIYEADTGLFIPDPEEFFAQHL